MTAREQAVAALARNLRGEDATLSAHATAQFLVRNIEDDPEAKAALFRWLWRDFAMTAPATETGEEPFKDHDHDGLGRHVHPTPGHGPTDADLAFIVTAVNYVRAVLADSEPVLNARKTGLRRDNREAHNHKP